MESLNLQVDRFNSAASESLAGGAAGKPSIVFLISHSAAGGAQEIWANIASGFRARGYSVQLMALYPRREPRPTPVGLPWTYVAKKVTTSPIDQAKMFFSLVDHFKKLRPVMVFTALPAANVIGAAAAKLAGAHVGVVTSHHSPAETYNPLLNVLDSVTGSLSSVKAVVSVSKVVAHSQADKPKLYLEKRRTIYNALPPDIEHEIAVLAKQRAGRARGRKAIATGRLAPQKNYPVLIRAAQHLPDVTIDIIGGGSEEAALKALAVELGVQDRVNFLGFKSRSETLRLLSEGDVFVQPSLFEGHSLALVEAAKLGLPLVVSDVPVQIESVTAANGLRCGLTAGPHDDVALADAIRTLLDDADVCREYTDRSIELGRQATYEVMLSAYEGLIV
jgi:glycosyltransferase involved in cell wall biosynthesis